MKSDSASIPWTSSQEFLQHGLRIILLICVAVILSFPGKSVAAVDIPVPSWLKRTAVAQNMVINGLPSVVYYFETNRNMEELLDFYRQKWDESAEKRAGYREAKAGPWHVISRLEGRYLFTVQAQQKDSFTTKGYLAIGDLQAIDRHNEPGKGVPKMNGSKVINDLTSYDPGKKGRTLMIANNFSVSGNSDYYRNYYLSRGWGQLIDQAGENSQVLAFGRSGEEAHLVISNAGGSTMVVMNLIGND